MAYNDDAVLARLSGLNESHDSISTAAQWIMFHRRHADRTVQLWLQRLKDSSSSRRLSLVYLANEVAQQSRIRHKEDFIIAFSPTVAEAISIAYKGAPTEIQGKLRRVVDVWRERGIFETPIQAAIQARLEELDKARGAAKPGFGGSPFSTPAAPAEFASVLAAQQKVTKATGGIGSTVTSAEQEYEKQTDPSAEIPSAPVYAARLNGLLQKIATAEAAMSICIKERESLVSELEKLLESNRTALEKDKTTASELSQKKEEIEEKKQQVEVAIMRALGPSAGNGSPGKGESASPPPEPDRPEMEALTPPPMEDENPIPGVSPELEPGETTLEPQKMSDGNTHSQQALSLSANGSNKRRRIDDGDDFPDLGGDDGIDADVAEMLKSDG